MTLPKKHAFSLPEDVIYLDGNSLGPTPLGVAERLQTVVAEEWGQQLIRAWNTADWVDLPNRVGDRVGRLIGAPKGSVAMGDTLTIKVFQALAAALKMRPGRKVILSDNGNFPTDLYMAQGLIDLLDADIVLKTPTPETVMDAITEEVAVVMLTHVDYRTGRMHDMAGITEAAHRAGAVMIWDLAHSAGAMPIDIAASQAEFAVGCTYKYLNGGPGAPAFIYARPDLIQNVAPALSGWFGHAAPFAFDLDYRPAMTTDRLRVGTPPILQMASLDAALDVWDDVDMADLRAASLQLSDAFIDEIEARCPQLTLRTPRPHRDRGSQVSFAFDNGYAAMQALIDRGVIGDFRAPDIMRFGFTPLYLGMEDISAAADIIEEVMTRELWRSPDYQVRSKVT